MWKLLRAASCAAVVMSVVSCGEEMQVVLPSEPVSDAGVMLVDAGVFDAGVPDAGTPDAGLEQPDAGLDAGAIVCSGLDGNGGFECKQAGWLVPEGTAHVISPGEEGLFALSVTTDSQGRARVAAAPFSMQGPTTLCLSMLARGTVANVRLEAWISPSNQAVTFAAPVSGSWSRVPPSRMAVQVPAGSAVQVVARAIGGTPGQVLELDGFEVTPALSGLCPP